MRHRLGQLFTEAPPPVAALVLLNGEPLAAGDVSHFWAAASNRAAYPCICADGAANLLHAHGELGGAPTHIVGDLDSVRPEVRAFYEARGTRIVHRPSQDSDDFHKALVTATDAAASSGGNLPIVVLGGMRGRLDQTLANIHQLYQCAQRGKAVCWVSGSDVATMLTPGEHFIDVGAGTTCGLIPVGGPVAKVETSGLKWDLHGTGLAFGLHNMVSSSNEAVNDVVRVSTSDPLLWTSGRPTN